MRLLFIELKAKIGGVSAGEVLSQESFILRDTVPELLTEPYCFPLFPLQHGGMFIVEGHGRGLDPYHYTVHCLVKTEQKHDSLRLPRLTTVVVSTHKRVYSPALVSHVVG